MKMFFVKCWETGSKPNVQQGRKWLSHSLTKHGRPPLNKYHRQHYNETLDMLKGLAKEPEWREHVPKSTAAFDLTAVQKGLHLQENIPRKRAQRGRRPLSDGEPQQNSRRLHDHQPWNKFKFQMLFIYLLS
jgi:hypothetical protein